MSEADAVVGSALASTSQATTSDGNGSDWRSALPEPLRAEKSLESFKDVGSLAKSYVEAQKMIGGSIRLPKSDAPPEEQDRILTDIFNKLGRPESPDKYAPTELPEGITFNEEAVKAFRADAHKNGYTQKQVDFALKHYATIAKNAMAENARLQTKAADEATTVLKTKWGGDFDTKLATAQRFTEQVLGDPIYELLKSKGLDNHPLIIEKFGELGAKFSEGKMETGQSTSATTQADAKAKLDAIYQNKEHPYHKGDAKAAEEVLELTRQMLGDAGRRLITTA
jgi:hypothetical protein